MDTTQEKAASRRPFEHEGYWLWRRKDTPHWHIYWCIPGSRRVRRKSTGTGDLARAKAELIAHATARKRLAPVDVEDACVRSLLVEHVERVMGRSKLRWPAEKTALKHWMEFFDREGVMCVADLSLDAQDRYVEWRLRTIRRLGKRGSTGTVNRELDVMKAALRSAWKRGRIANPPYVRSAPQPPPRDRTLTAEECRRLLIACEPEPHLRRFVLLMLHTLQRPVAIFDLRVEQVDLERGRIDFLPPGEVQSFKRRPVVPITATLRPELENAIAESNTGHILEYGGKPIRSVQRAFRTAARRAGLTGVHPYVLRHTGATLLAAAGVPLRQIAGMLGHSEQRTTELYAKHRPEYLKDAATALDEMFGAAFAA